MYSAFLSAVLVAAIFTAAPAVARELRVCADPNNLPFSNERGEGFENKIAEIVAEALDAQLTYFWWAQRRGFVRNTLSAQTCDLVPGTVFGSDVLRSSRPYYRSTYVFVTRSDRHLHITSLDDAVLRTAIVGVQLIGDDGANSPPAHALARRGIVQNVRGFPVYGDRSASIPAAGIVAAVAAGEIDVAVVWGPLAGYLAANSGVPLKLAPVLPQVDGPLLPMVFDISMGVRRDDTLFRDEIDRALVDRRGDIDRVLAAYNVPRVDRAAQPARFKP